jgi:hypothetical protein
MIIPDSGLMTKVTGTSSASPMVALSPGIQPLTRPKATPLTVASMLAGVRASASPSSKLQLPASVVGRYLL